MKTNHWLMVIFPLAILLMGCEKEKQELKEGQYKGTFTVSYGSSKQMGEVTLEIKEGTYSCSGNPDRIPAGGSGTYSVDGHKILFFDNNAWTADFDWELILCGQYEFTANGTNLFFSKR